VRIAIPTATAIAPFAAAATAFALPSRTASAIASLSPSGRSSGPSGSRPARIASAFARERE